MIIWHSDVYPGVLWVEIDMLSWITLNSFSLHLLYFLGKLMRTGGGLYLGGGKNFSFWGHWLSTKLSSDRHCKLNISVLKFVWDSYFGKLVDLVWILWAHPTCTGSYWDKPWGGQQRDWSRIHTDKGNWVDDVRLFVLYLEPHKYQKSSSHLGEIMNLFLFYELNL